MRFTRTEQVCSRGVALPPFGSRLGRTGTSLLPSFFLGCRQLLHTTATSACAARSRWRAARSRQSSSGGRALEPRRPLWRYRPLRLGARSLPRSGIGASDLRRPPAPYPSFASARDAVERAGHARLRFHARERSRPQCLSARSSSARVLSMAALPPGSRSMRDANCRRHPPSGCDGQVAPAP